MSRFLAALIATVICSAGLSAHDIQYQSTAGTFLDTTDGASEEPFRMVLSTGSDGTITALPLAGEGCEVNITLSLETTRQLRSPNPLISVAGVAIPALAPKLTIKVLREPVNRFAETFQILGTWAATGKTSKQEVCNGKGDIWAKVTIIVSVLQLSQVGGIALFEQSNATTIGDPVSTSTGEINGDFTDFSLGGPLSIDFQRHYGSVLNTSSAGSALGPNWMHSLDHTLVVSGNIAAVFLYPGKVVRFQQTGSAWQVAGPERYSDQLVSSGGTFQFLDLRASLTYTFSSTGALTAVRDRNGNTLAVRQGPFGPISVADGLGRTLTFTYAGMQLSAVSDQTGRRISFTYTGSSLAAATDALGRTTKYNYAAAAQDGLLASTLMPAGNTPWAQNFDASGRVVRQADSGDNPTSIAFDQPAPGMRQITDPLGRVTTHTYDGSGNLMQNTDAAGRSTTFAYDSNFHLTSSTDRLGNKTAISYHAPSGFPASVTDAAGKTTSFTYTAQTQGSFTFFNLTKIDFADGTSASVGYDNAGNILTLTDQAGKVTTYKYNSRGQLLTITNAVGGVTSITYNNDGTVASVKSPAGDLTTYTYDPQKRPVKVQFSDNTSGSFAWDAMNNLLSATDERGKVSRFAYNPNNHLQSTTDALNQSSSYTYDTDDLVTSATDALGHVTRAAYDPMGSMTAMTNPAGERTSFSYDSLNRLQSVADPSGKGPSFTYDAEGRLATLTDALANTTSFNVDQLGRTIRIRTPRGENHGFTYDALARLTTATDPLLQTTAYGYDSRGLLAAVTLPGGIAAAYARDDLGSITKITDPNGGAWAAAYDNMGRVKSRTDPLGRVTTFTYDARNRVSALVSPEGTAVLTYDGSGNLTRILYSDSTDLRFSYDDDNRVIGANSVQIGYDAAGRIVRSNGLAITRDDAGRIASIASPQGVVTYGYDARGLLSSVSDWAGGGVTLSYNDAGDVVSLSRSNGVTAQFTYDANRRLVGITESGGDASLLSIALTRDAAGRIVSADRNLPNAPDPGPAGMLPLGYDAAHQMAGATYDRLGRLTGGFGRKYVWDLASRLTSYSGADGAAASSYDGFGQRITRTTADGMAQNFVLNYATALPSVAAVQSGGADLRYYVYLPDGSLLYSIEAGNNSRHFYSFDEAGSTVMLTGDDGKITDSYGITPYGETVTHAGASDNPFTFHGQWGVMEETGTGLFYMRFRWYDSAAARFLTRDPVKSLDPLSINPYQYAVANPISYMDPTGLNKQKNPTSRLVPRFSNVLLGSTYSGYPICLETQPWDCGTTTYEDLLMKLTRSLTRDVLRKFNERLAKDSARPYPNANYPHAVPNVTLPWNFNTSGPVPVIIQMDISDILVPVPDSVWGITLPRSKYDLPQEYHLPPIFDLENRKRF